MPSLDNLEELLLRVFEEIPGEPGKAPNEFVGACLLLALSYELLGEKLEQLKPMLREHARSKLPETPGKKVVLPAEWNASPIGEVAVTFQNPRVTPKDIKLLREALGPELFALLFEEKIAYSPRKGFLSLLENLPPEKREVVLNSVQVGEDTPRVSFPSKRWNKSS